LQSTISWRILIIFANRKKQTESVAGKIGSKVLEKLGEKIFDEFLKLFMEKNKEKKLTIEKGVKNFIP
jgi:hypothetical protein